MGPDDQRALATEARSVLDAAWREPGFCVPNGEVYPHQWLWDSCFHAIAWSAVGSDRGVQEIANALSAQADDGFVPHMIYWHHPDLHAEFWGRPRLTPITQPPMYGHALAVLADRGQSIADELIERARRGIIHLAERSRTGGGLIPVLHPWETGCDDSPRWDHRFDDGGPENGWQVDRVARRQRKKEFVDALRRGSDGHGLASDAFAVGSIGFNALVAWNATELLRAFPGVDGGLSSLASELTHAVSSRWNGSTWTDDWSASTASGPEGGAADRPEAEIRTLDTMLALLVDPRREPFAELIASEAFGATYGPCGVDRREPAYRPDQYWRGSTWPQLVYLLVMAARQHAGAAPHGLADTLSRSLVEGARRSGWAEYWHPDTGEGYGARPQTWATLAVTMAG